MAAEDHTGFLARLAAATSAHDLEALVDCFTDDYVLTQPAHPSRTFTGSAQVRSNWAQIFAAVPDLVARVTRQVADGSTLWSEWEMSGTRRDGAHHQMRGVMIFGLRGERAEWGTFYLEPVDEDTTGVDDAIRRQVTGGAP